MFERYSSVSITVQLRLTATDSTGQTGVANITIHVTDVNDNKPYFEFPSLFGDDGKTPTAIVNISEASEAGFEVYHVKGINMIVRSYIKKPYFALPITSKIKFWCHTKRRKLSAFTSGLNLLLSGSFSGVQRFFI